MRARSDRSHHSVVVAPGVKEPRIATPSDDSRSSAASTSLCPTANERASASLVTGPSPSRRPRTISSNASSRGHWRVANSAGEPAPAHHGLRTALLERRIVEIGVRSRGEDLQREWRRLREVAGDHLHLAGFNLLQEALEAFDVHRLV